MRRSTKWLLAAGILAFLLIVIANIPASLAGRWIPGNIHVAALNGTMWHGEALSVQAGAIDIERLEWRLHPLALLTGRFAARIEASTAPDRLTAEISLDRSGKIEAHAVAAELDAASFAGRALPTGWSGPFAVHLDELVIENRWVTKIRGGAESGVLSGPPAVKPYLGSYRLTFGDDADAAPEELRGHFQDTGGPIEISGEARLYRDRRAIVSGWVRARPDAPQVVVDDIAKLPESDPQGRKRFSIENSF
jgi:general secretion pathway protein N